MVQLLPHFIESNMLICSCEPHNLPIESATTLWAIYLEINPSMQDMLRVWKCKEAWKHANTKDTVHRWERVELQGKGEEMTEANSNEKEESAEMKDVQPCWDILTKMVSRMKFQGNLRLGWTQTRCTSVKYSSEHVQMWKNYCFIGQVPRITFQQHVFFRVNIKHSLFIAKLLSCSFSAKSDRSDCIKLQMLYVVQLPVSYP